MKHLILAVMLVGVSFVSVSADLHIVDPMWPVISKSKDGTVFRGNLNTLKKENGAISIMVETVTSKTRKVEIDTLSIVEADCNQGYGLMTIRFSTNDGYSSTTTDWIKGGRSVASGVGSFLCSHR